MTRKNTGDVSRVADGRWPELLGRYERALRKAEVYDAPALLEAERAIRTKLRATPAAEQAVIAARVRRVEEQILGWCRPTAWSDEAAPELRSLGFLEGAIVESRRLR